MMFYNLRHTSKILLVLTLFFLSGCVISSDTDIIKNNDATVMFGGQQNLLWIDNDGQQILLERLSGDWDNSYMAQDIANPADSSRVRFLSWPEFELLPGESAFIATAEMIDKNNVATAWYYQLLTYDSTRNIWATWSFDPPDGKELKVRTLDELKKSLTRMIKDKHFKRRELIVFRASGEGTSGDIK